MPVSCHFQGCKELLRTIKRRYIKYHAFAFAFFCLHVAINMCINCSFVNLFLLFYYYSLLYFLLLDLN